MRSAKVSGSRVVALFLLLAVVRAPAQSVGLLREVWESLEGGTDLASLTSSPDYPNRPTTKNYVEDLFEAPVDVLDNYGQRLHGYVVPPLTGNYTFWIASDDQGALFLSTDENPDNARRIANVASWTAPREWEKEPNQRSQPVSLTAGKAYYVSALMKEGGGGDNLAVRWLMPNGIDQAPIVGTNLLPFGVSFTAPTIARQPTNTVAVEGTLALFSVALSTVGPATYTWRRNGTALPNSNAPELRFGPVRLADSGSRFGVIVTNAIGSTTSSEAVLSVTPDVTSPGIVQLLNIGVRTLRITFSEPVSPESATRPANYSISPGVVVRAARMGPNPETVELEVDSFVFGNRYSLAPTGITDLARTPNLIAVGSVFPFVAVEYAPATVGSPGLPGSTAHVEAGATMIAGGQLGGRSDSFEFAYQLVSGDFDRRVRVAAFDPTDPFATAGLMARATLEPASSFAAALATPGSIGSFLLSRASIGAEAQRTGSAPVDYPRTWLRLARSGNTFRAFVGHDGTAWSELGSVTLALPNQLFLGFTAAGRDPVRTTTVEFRDAGPTVGPTLLARPPARAETPGPSSRLTALVVSEIMYHPQERPDGRQGEFVEIYNADLVDQDLSGHRLSGDLDYAFPDGFVLHAGAFAVVARNPADLVAIHGLARVLGPFEGTRSLPNGGGTIRLRNRENAILLEVAYATSRPWPVAADGAGPSLVLTRPSYGEADPRAWSASEAVGGSPGTHEPLLPNPYSTIVLNEILAHTDLPRLDFVELYNHGNETLDLSGCILTDDVSTNRFRIPQGVRVTPRGFVAFDETELGFRLSASGEALFLFDPARTRVIDAVRFGPQENGVSSGRYPDGTPEWRRLASLTPGTENDAFRVSPVVINEILYNPVSGDDADEFVEIYNRTASDVSLGDWSFTDGIDFRFPANFVLPASGYVVVAKNRARILANNPALSPNLVVGDYRGTLSNGGERLALAMPDRIVSTNALGLATTNHVDIEIDEVSYATGGRWGEWSDGLGSSLELVDPYSDHLQPSNWADSDESGKAPWTTIEFTGRVDNAAEGVDADRLHLLTQGPGEYLVDDLQVLGTDARNRLANGDFAVGISGWTAQGNHRRSSLAEGAGPDGSNAYRIRATGRGDTAVNRVRAAISPVLPLNSTATLRARVRWLRGWPEFLLRTRGNGLEAYGRLAVPRQCGTPGSRNSRAVENAGPAIHDVSHSPPVPRANEPVLVTARVTDPDGIDTVILRHRTDPQTTLATLAMRDDGTSGDLVAGDGIYSARITGRSAGTQIAFTIRATDRESPSATTQFPPPDAFPIVADREALVRWGETRPFGNLGIYRFWQRQRDYDNLRNREPLSNDPLDCTFVYADERVVYNAEMRAKGSPWHGGSVGGDYVFTLPEGDRLLGARDMAVVTLGNLGSDPSAQREQAAFWIGRQMGIASLHRRHVHFFENGGFKGLYEDTEEPNGLYVDRWFPDGPDGELFKIEDWFEFNDTGNSFVFSRDATLQRFTSGGSLKQARYRWAWRKRAVERSANDYAALLQLVDTVANATATSAPRIDALVDIENWMRTFALQHVVGNWDAYGHSRGKNSYLYLPTGGRWKIIPWDIDFVLGSSSDGPTTGLFASVDPVVSRIWEVPPFRRAYWRAYRDAVAGPLAPEKIDALLDARYAALVANGFTIEHPSSIKNWVRQRRAFIASQVAAQDTPDLAVTTNGGNDFASDTSTVTLTGRAPLVVRTLLVNGTPYPVTWTSTVNWSLTLALSTPTNHLVVSGLDAFGRPVPGLSDTITIRFSGSPPNPAGSVVVNEIQFDPAVPGAGFVEILNTSSAAAFDLSGWRLDGTGFDFPAGTFLPPGSFAVVAADLAVFRSTYGSTVIPLGSFPGRLQNGGERLRLLRPGPTPGSELVVDELRYDGEPPWPTNASGTGASLQLVDPRLDRRRPANWTAAIPSNPPLSTPGRANSLAATLAPFPNVWINEVQPVNRTGPTDRAGDRDPWIELYNPGDLAVDLAGLFLSVDPLRLDSWVFPTETILQPRQFLVIWCDGEPTESSPGELHVPLRLPATNGIVTIARLQNGAPAALDSLRYRALSDDRSFGSIPDGHPLERFVFQRPTPASPNTLATGPLALFVNEWMASNASTLRDPADRQFADWFEIHNAANTPVDLSGFLLSDSLQDANPTRIPDGTVVPAAGFLLVWADAEIDQTRPGQLHVGFRLSALGDSIVLRAPDGLVVDHVTFGAQADDRSQGRFPDAHAEPFLDLDIPTPAAPNAMLGGNLPPVLAALPEPIVDEETVVSFTVAASDPDPSQKLTFSLEDAPPAAALDPASGAFRWATTEADGPGVYPVAVRVTDSGNPARSHRRSTTIVVREVNRPPVLEAVPSRKVGEGDSLSFTVVARDPDLPPQRLVFTLPDNPPSGAAIDPESGFFTWTPNESQGPNTYRVFIGVLDDQSPPLGTGTFVTIAVTEVDNPPVFDLVGLQSVEELAPWSLAIVARDPDTPAKKVTYRIDASPSGVGIDPVSGTLRWTPPETAGPGSYPVTVRATEEGSTVSSTLTFSIDVYEKNEPPRLDAIGDILADEGSVIGFDARASDTDLPAQRLTFRLEPGAPDGASIDPQSGRFQWAISPDAGPSTNRLSISVADNAIDAKTATRSFTVTVRASPKIVINEIHYAPAIAATEFVELFNTSGSTGWNLSGWRLAGLDFEFPAGTRLDPARYLVVARDRAAFRAAFGSSATLVGDAKPSFPATGPQFVRLQRPTPESGWETLDEVAFLRDIPWPPQANGRGPSLQLVDALQDNRRIANWTAMLGATTNAARRVLEFTHVWKYKQDGPAPAAWRERSFDDTAWPAGRGLLYVEDASLPAAKTTPLTRTEGRFTYYFRTRFTFTGNPDGASLVAMPIVDDGAVIYLNGREVFRIGIDANPVVDTTPASRTVPDATSEGPFTFPVTNLISGENVLAVEVHQVNATSSDIVWGTTLDVLEVRRESVTPGYANSVRAVIPSFPDVWISEILPRNVSGILDNAGDRDPWVEIFHGGTDPLTLSGWWLTDDLARPTRWPFPPGAVLLPRAHRLVWADGEPEETSPTAWHASFRIAPSGGNLALVRDQNGSPAIVDFVAYPGTDSDQSYGIRSPAEPLGHVLQPAPSPGIPNGTQPPDDGPIRITEIHLENDGGLRLAWSSTPGRRYAIETRDTLDAPWGTVPGEITATASTTVFRHTREATTQSYFRIRRLQD